MEPLVRYIVDANADALEGLPGSVGNDNTGYRTAKCQRGVDSGRGLTNHRGNRISCFPGRPIVVALREIPLVNAVVEFETIGTGLQAPQFISTVGIGVDVMATKAIYGEDLLLAAGVDYKPYFKLINERASAQRVAADRKAASSKV